MQRQRPTHQPLVDLGFIVIVTSLLLAGLFLSRSKPAAIQPEPYCVTRSDAYVAHMETGVNQRLWLPCRYIPNETNA